MTSMNIIDNDIPSLQGKVAVITGGASGIGLAAVKILLSKGAIVHVVDRNEPIETGWQGWSGLHYHKCDVTQFIEQRTIFDSIGPIHMAFANAGVAETVNFFADSFDADGKLQRPDSLLLDVNVTGVLYTVKLAWSSMRRHQTAGSIVITTSTTAFAPEAALPTYSAGKLALVGLVRSLRNNTVMDNITINAVAPAGTHTPLVGSQLDPLVATGLPITSPAHLPALALVYSATATQSRRVEVYGKEQEKDLWRAERWNGRIIYVLGDRFSELEEPTADLRPYWFGKENHRLVKLQQAATDGRDGVDGLRM